MLGTEESEVNESARCLRADEEGVASGERTVALVRAGDHCPNQLVQDQLCTSTGRACGRKRKKPVPEGPAQTMASPQAVAAFRVQAS